MFYFMMTWFFMHKNKDLLSKLVALLMAVIGLQCLKDLFFLSYDSDIDNTLWRIMSATDMIAVPLYAFILRELCRPTSLTLRLMIMQELTFMVPIILFVITKTSAFYYITVVWTAVYGFGYAVWTIITIPKYHAMLKERFSYDENINLNWLKIILGSFAIILSLWIIDCLIVNLDIEALYMLGSLVIWIFIYYFIYRHESVINELIEPIAPDESFAAPEDNFTGLREHILNLFEKDRIYLNPQLRLSDVAAMANSNRTYVSRFFNSNHGKTFFEFVNEYRVRYAKTLLKSSDEKLDVIAERCGFRSRQSFHRVFIKMTGCTPEQYRISSTD